MTVEKKSFLISPKVLLVCLLILQGSCKTSQPQTAAKNPDANHEKITSKIRDIVAKKLELDPSAIDVDAPLSKQKAPGDELDATEIILDIEDEFHIEIKEEETGGTEQLANRLTVKKLADIVAKKSPK
jgi:acyl carrier protein